MAIDLGAITNTTKQVINGVTNTLNTLTSSTSANASNFRSAVNATARNSGSGLSPSNFNLSSVGGLANQVLGDNNAISKVLNQTANAVGAINKIAGASGALTDLTKNPKALSGIVSGALASKGLGSFASTVESLSSLGSTIANKSSIGAFNQVSVVNRSAQELAGVAEIQSARKFMESFKPDISALLSNLGSKSESTSDGAYSVNSKGRIENPLRQHNTSNYIISLGILDAQQLNNPASYRQNGASFKKILIKSGGGERNAGYANRVRTAAEGDENAEYYIEDLELNAVIAPNPNTSVALGTNVSFKIIEPYSMGKFIEAMLVGAEECGFSSYIDAPFCLKIEFVGWDERGERDISVAKPAYIPIKINKMDFNVGQQGSTYQCTAVPYSEVALGDVANKTKIPISSYGKTVSDILEIGKESVTYTINGQIENLEDKKIIKGYDRYLIAFPKNKQDLVKAIEGGSFDISALQATSRAEDQERIRLGVGQPVRNPDPDFPNQNIPVVSPTAPNTYLYLKAWASNTANMNEFGLSTIVADSRDGADQPHPTAGSVVDNQTRTVRVSNPSSAPAEQSRKFNFTEGCNITDIIEEVLLSSTYVKELATAEPVNGMKRWFRVETMVFIEPNAGGVEAEIGRPRKTYVYAVHPFWTYEARHLAPGQKPRNIEQLKQLAKKEYNYYYTGQNEDVLDFDINFNNAFFQNIRSDLGQNSSTTTGQQVTSSGSGQTPGTTIAPAGDQATPASRNGEPTATVELTAQNRSSSNGGYRIGNVDDKRKRAIAENFHSRLLNSPVDMITAEMEIWGDPYYLPSDVGNYSSPPGEPSVTGDGTMAFMRDEVYVVVNFRTPLDYLINGSTMNFPSYVKPFSGLYQVISTVSNFNSGQFKQKIKMIRVPGQNGSSENTTNGSGVLQLADSSKNFVPDPAANANPNPENIPVTAPPVNVNEVVSRFANTNADEGITASFSQARLMTGDPQTGVETIITNPLTSLASALPPDQLASLPIDPSSRLGLTADLTTTIFPLKLPSRAEVSAAAGAVTSAVRTVNSLAQSGLNIPASGALPFNLGNTSTLTPNFTNETASRIQSTVNTALSGLSTQARPSGLRPPTI